MAVDVKQMTVEDLLAMPDDGRRHELVRGELIEMPQPGQRHGRIQLRIGRLLAERVEDADLGTVVTDNAVIIKRDPATVRGPDVAIYLGDVIDPDEEPLGFSERVPEIVVEIVSPSNSALDIYEKTQQFLRAGVRMVVAVWLTENEVTVETTAGRSAGLTVDDILDLSDVAPGLVIPVASIFKRT